MKGNAAGAGSAVAAETVLGTIDARGGELPATAPEAATLVEWFAEDGDPVSAGRLIARLEPKETQ